MKKENVKSADKKPEVYTDDKGRKRVRMVSVDREIIKTNEKSVSKAQQKFFGIVRGLQKGEIDDASPEAKKAAASMSKKDVKDFAKTKHKGLPARKEGYIGKQGEKGRDYHNAGTFDKNTAYSHAKKHNGVVHKDPSGKYLVKHGKGKHVGEATDAEVKKKQDFLDRLRGKPPVKKEANMSDKAGPGKGKDMRDMSKMDHAKARDYHQRLIKKKDDYHYKMSKIHHRNAIGGSSMMHKEEVQKEYGGPKITKKQYIAYGKKYHAKKEDEACWDGYKQVGMKKKGDKMVPNCVPESFKSFIDEAVKLTPAQIKRRDARKAARDADGRSSAARKLKPRAAKPAARNTKAKQKADKAKPLGFEIKKTDHHSTVHQTIAKAADAMHPSLGNDARSVSLKINGKKKVYTSHKDLQHVVDYHRKLKNIGQKADLMRSVRSGGHDAISKHTTVYRKVTKQ